MYLLEIKSNLVQSNVNLNKSWPRQGFVDSEEYKAKPDLQEDTLISH